MEQAPVSTIAARGLFRLLATLVWKPPRACRLGTERQTGRCSLPSQAHGRRCHPARPSSSSPVPISTQVEGSGVAVSSNALPWIVLKSMA